MEVNIGSLMRGQGDIIKKSEFYGIYRAWVKDNNDPEKRGRIRVEVPYIHPEDLDVKMLPWAEYCAPDGGGDNRGVFLVPDVGDTVWVQFEAGDKNFPVWVGTWYGLPNNKSEIPKDAQEGAYPKRRVVYKSRNGHTIVVSDESGKEFIHIYDKEGDELKLDTTNKELTITSIENMNLDVGKNLTIDVGGDYKISVGGKYDAQVDGIMSEVVTMTRTNKALRIDNQMS